MKRASGIVTNRGGRCLRPPSHRRSLAFPAVVVRQRHRPREGWSAHHRLLCGRDTGIYDGEARLLTWR